VRVSGDDVVTTDGPFVEAREHLGGADETRVEYGHGYLYSRPSSLLMRRPPADPGRSGFLEWLGHLVWLG
jgi:hypothetical protein